ncbi:pyrroline-5-carboxylate reductase family protein [Neorhizobium alkalisoli]|uniref:pyrroline-5-carboxylate reductase family protein n=1 Tax=Neorhizobium alkalisoli TaxID=528178 RepID=UPI000CF8FF43|nr:pyrroline-5-carboxylate reductase dimerization domain-containing protein [Neorhizobium alkalisoli]
MADIGRVGIVGGAGWLGTAIARALLDTGTVPSDRLTCSFRSRKPETALACTWTQDNAQLAENSDVIILSVRPADWSAIEISAAGKLVVSVMAGVPVEAIKRRTGSSRVARALPNAAAEIGFSYTPFFVDSLNPEDTNAIATLFRSCGAVDQVDSESHIDYFTGMSGSGAAFPALLADAMMKDALARGVPEELARRAAQQVLIGAGRLQEHNGSSPSETVRSFVDYKGTTAAAIVAMQENGFYDTVAAGLQAAFQTVRTLQEANSDGNENEVE